jgi:chaperonin cofactor prefoldin
MVDEFEYKALVVEMEMLRSMNRMLNEQIKKLQSALKHPAGKGNRDKK